MEREREMQRAGLAKRVKQEGKATHCKGGKRLRLIPLILGGYGAFLGFGLAVIGLAEMKEGIGIIRFLTGLGMAGFGLWGIWDGVRDLVRPDKKPEQAPVSQFILTDTAGNRSSLVTPELLRKQMDILTESQNYRSFTLQILPPLPVEGFDGRLTHIICFYRSQIILAAYLENSKEGYGVYQKSTDPDKAVEWLKQLLAGNPDFSEWDSIEVNEVEDEETDEEMEAENGLETEGVDREIESENGSEAEGTDTESEAGTGLEKEGTGEETKPENGLETEGTDREIEPENGSEAEEMDEEIEAENGLETEGIDREIESENGSEAKGADTESEADTGLEKEGTGEETEPESHVLRGDVEFFWRQLLHYQKGRMANWHQLLVIFGESWHDEHKFFSARDVELAVEGIQQGKYQKVVLEWGIQAFDMFPGLQNDLMVIWCSDNRGGGDTRFFAREGTVTQVKFWLNGYLERGFSGEMSGWTDITDQIEKLENRTRKRKGE